MLLYMRKTDYILNIPSAARMNGNTYKLENRGKKMRVESGVLWAEKFFQLMGASIYTPSFGF